MKKNNHQSLDHILAAESRSAADKATRTTRIAGTGTTVMKKAGKAPRKVKKSVRKGGGKRPVNNTLTSPGGSTSAAQVIRALRKVDPATRDWARLVQSPFVGDQGIKCPFTFNPVPSLSSFTATTVNTCVTKTVIGGQTRQLCLWPGHYPMQEITIPVGTGATDAAQMDETSYHQGLASVSGGAYNVGPCSSITGTGSTVSTSAMVISASTAAALNGAVIPDMATSENESWDNPLPILANPGQYSHLRWKMTAMGIRIKNISAAAVRGGSIITVQPSYQINVADFASQSKFSIFPSFREWGDGGEGIELTWIPRPQDLAYWHLGTARTAAAVDASDNRVLGPGILIWLNADGASVQTYEWQQVAHWELAGVATQAFSQPTVATTVNDSHLKMALGHQSAQKPTAEGFAAKLESVVSNAGERAVDFGVKTAKSVLKSGGFA